jgi:hypothetical protein
MGQVRLLVSTFSADEARSAIQGGADIVDVEDPKADVGMYSTGDIADIIYGVRQAEGSRVVRTSVNIGANLLLYSAAGQGPAAPRNLSDIQARAGQEALGIAAAMDVGDVRPNIIKFGVDGLHRDDVVAFVRAVKTAIRKSGRHQSHQVLGSFLPIDSAVWQARKKEATVIEQLVRQGTYYFDPKGSIDVTKILGKEETEKAMKKAGATSPQAELIEPSDPLALGFSSVLMDRTKDYVDLIVEGGADGVMIDTPVQAKAARICLLDHEKNGDNPPNGSNGLPLPLVGLYKLEELRKFTNYCEFKGVESWCAGSIQFFHAERLGTLRHLDVMLCRGVVSALVTNPFGDGGSTGADRTSRRIDADLVARMAKILRDAVPAV